MIDSAPSMSYQAYQKIKELPAMCTAVFNLADNTLFRLPVTDLFNNSSTYEVLILDGNTTEFKVATKKDVMEKVYKKQLSPDEYTGPNYFPLLKVCYCVLVVWYELYS